MMKYFNAIPVLPIIIFYVIGAFLGKEASSINIMIYTLINTAFLLVVLGKLDNIEKKIKEKK